MDFNTDQIWNQPAFRYHVYGFETLTTSQAANLVASGTETGTMTSYPFNSLAKGFVKVDFGIQWVSENGPNTEPVSGLDSASETRMVAVIELDADASNPNANVIGGEYLDDENAGADRLTTPPFVWRAVDTGPENLPLTGTRGHNPYVKPSLIKQL